MIPHYLYMSLEICHSGLTEGIAELEMDNTSGLTYLSCISADKKKMLRKIGDMRLTYDTLLRYKRCIYIIYNKYAKIQV
jgi:hypothetical protein